MKKICAIFLCLCMLCSITLPIFANEYESLPEEEYLPEEEVIYVPETIEHRIFVDGKELPCEPGYLIDGYSVYYRYTTVAEAFGFSVSYDAETGMVHTEGNGYAITFDAIAANASGTHNGEPTDIYEDQFIYDFINMDDKLYIEDFAVKYDLADYSDREIRVDDETNDIYVYTAEGKQAMADALNKNFTILNSMQAEVQGKDYVSEGVSEIVLNLKSDFLEIEGKGQSVISVTSAKLGDKSYTKIHTDGKGLMNLIPLLTGIVNSYGEAAEHPADFPDSTDVELYFDGVRLYIKGEEATRQLLMQEAGWITYEFPEKTAEIAKQWICTENIPEEQLSLWTEGNLGSILVDLAFTSGNNTLPEEIIAVFQALFSDENFTVTDDAQGKTYTYTLNKEAFLAALEPVTSDMNEEERNAFYKQMESFGFEMTAVQNTTKDGGVSLSEANISVSNIENPWNEQMFSLYLSLKTSEEFSFSGAESFAFPDVSQAVNLTEFVDNLSETPAEDMESEDE